jgi:hypothetical protein
MHGMRASAHLVELLERSDKLQMHVAHCEVQVGKRRKRVLSGRSRFATCAQQL